VARKRLDGIGKLTPAQKAERDARAQYWMNQRKIERVAEAAERSGYFQVTADEFYLIFMAGQAWDGDDGWSYLQVKDGVYRLVSMYAADGGWLLRKVKHLDL